MAIVKDVWETLSKIDVSKHIEKKMGLSYVSWAWAWGMVKKEFSKATFKNCNPVNNPDLNYFSDGKTAWVEVEVTIQDESIRESLPVMDFRNKSIPLNALTSMDVNKALKRCLVKCLALFGLGLNVYAGEDLPIGDDEATLQTTSQSTSQTVQNDSMQNFKEDLPFSSSTDSGDIQKQSDYLMKLCEDYQSVADMSKTNVKAYYDKCMQIAQNGILDEINQQIKTLDSFIKKQANK